jgi:hypothetical protein
MNAITAVMECALNSAVIFQRQVQREFPPNKSLKSDGESSFGLVDTLN